MPLIPRLFLSDTPTVPFSAPYPDATAGLGYDSATRSYVDRMGRISNAAQAPRNLLDSLQSTGRVVERFVNGPGDNLSAASQIARSQQAKSFWPNIRNSIGRKARLAGKLGLGAAGLYGAGVLAHKGISGGYGLGSNLVDYMFDSTEPTIGVEENYLEPTIGSGNRQVVSTPAASVALPDENQLMQRFMPSMFRDNFANVTPRPSVGVASTGLLNDVRTRPSQSTDIDDANGGWLGGLSRISPL